MSEPAPLVAAWTAAEPPLDADLSRPHWRRGPEVALARQWSGEAAPAGLETTVRLLWTAADLWVGFACRYVELDIDEAPDASVERAALWERDVCEIFVRSAAEPDAASYKEFEVAPTAQWCDLAIRRPRLDVDWHWQSGMRTAAAIDAARRRFTAVMQIPFAALGGPPTAGDRWRANLFRVGRIDGRRHYLAWAPTGTPAPDFHVPDRFVPLRFAAPGV
ncbi:MAG: carbohydrate-binding family 9-like protein [Vicinamibacterales bacterium]